MGGLKKKGSRAKVESAAGDIQPEQRDMSKYKDAYSNKSKVNYNELKLARPDKANQQEKPVGSEKKKASEPAKGKKEKAAKSLREKEKKPEKTKKTGKPADSRSKKAAKAQKNAKAEKKAPQVSAAERYSNALGKDDHYSSAVEKYYLKYPDKKRPERSAAPRTVADQTVRKRRHSGSGGTKMPYKRSMAEIAVKNKGVSSVRKRARAARSAKARGVVSPKVANRSFYRRKRKRSGALNVLMVTLLLVFLSAAGIAVFLNVRQITVKGDSPYSEAQVKAICSIKKGGNILFINTEELEKKVERELPYIAECSIQRRLPSTVVINVVKADVLGVVRTDPGIWAVISTEGKILESSARASAGGAEQPEYTPSSGSAEDIAESRKLPVITGIDIKDNIKNGFITDDTALRHIRDFVLIRHAFKKTEMNLTSVSFGDRGYEAEYDGRLVIIFGREIDQKTVLHRMKEVHALIFDKGYIGENDMGEVCFNKQYTHFRQSYKISEEETEQVRRERREANRERLVKMAEVFVATGLDWYNGKIKTE